MTRLASLPSGCEPMLLHSQKKPFQHVDWIYQPKLDGMRCIAVIESGQVQLFSRNQRNITRTFPAIARALQNQPRNLVVDGEIVVFNKNGEVDFENLQSRWLIDEPLKAAEQDRLNPAVLYVFDLIRIDGSSMISKGLIERKTTLNQVFVESPLAKLVSHFDDGLALFETCREHKFEGVVAKRAASTYKPGTRSKDWIKIKYTQKDTFGIVGHVENEGFLLAHYSIEGVKMVGCVQYGFSSADYDRLSKMLKQVAAPMKSKKPTVWFKPVAVEIEFMEWTKRGLLRFPVFKGFA